MTENVLFSTIIGSHVWNMNTAMSDTDIFEAYVASTEDILRGTANTKSKFIQKDGVDTAQHEIGKIVNQLLKGNFNFIVGVMSPIVEKNSMELYQLSCIVEKTISKNCYGSIHGMAQHNFKKYIVSGKDTSERRCNKILRGLKFGMRIMDGRGIKFEKVENGTEEDIGKAILMLDESFNNSKLSDKPDEEPFRDWLYQVRINEWYGVI